MMMMMMIVLLLSKCVYVCLFQVVEVIQTHSRKSR